MTVKSGTHPRRSGADRTPVTVDQPLAKADDVAMRRARVMTDGSCNAVVVQQYLPSANGGDGVQALVELGREQAEAVARGDLTQLEAMLLSQASALQAMFVDLACRAKDASRLPDQHLYTTLALKCAGQSRQAITALAELKAPRMAVFANQANISTAPQQINNADGAVSPFARARKNKVQPENELLEQVDEQRLDPGEESTPSATDPQLASVGSLDRPRVRRR